MAVKAIPVAVRERIIQLYGQGKGTAEIAASFGYCVAAVRRIRQHFKERGTLKPQTHRCGRKTLLTDSRKARLLQLLERRPDATLAELGAPLKRPTSTIDLWLTRLGWSCKKNAARQRTVATRRGGATNPMATAAGGRVRRSAGVRG
jgi:transposase